MSVPLQWCVRRYCSEWWASLRLCPPYFTLWLHGNMPGVEKTKHPFNVDVHRQPVFPHRQRWGAKAEALDPDRAALRVKGEWLREVDRTKIVLL